MKTYKILVPKPAAINEQGTEVGLYSADDMVTPKGEWQQDIMDSFVENGWAMEVKAIQPEETVTIEAEVSITEEKSEVEEAPKKKRGRPKKSVEEAVEED
tara:strand:- start:23 stop:322 length:300 start_codon:yes stop_codon:yes gene_type:complete